MIKWWCSIWTCFQCSSISDQEQSYCLPHSSLTPWQRIQMFFTCFMPFDNDDSISDDVWDYEIMKFPRNEAGHGSPWAGQSFVTNNLLHGWIRVTRHCHHCQWRCILLHLHDHRQVATGRQPKVSPTRSWRKLSAFTSSFRWRIMMMMIIVMIMTIICRSQTYVQHLRRQVRSHFVFETIL